MGDAGVDLVDDLIGGVEGLHLPLQVAGDAAVAVLVHGGHTHHDHVGPLAVELLAIVVQVHGEIGGHAGGMDLPEVAVIEEGLVMELVLVRSIGVNRILRGPSGGRRTTAPRGCWDRCDRRSGGGCDRTDGARSRGWS